MSMTATRYTYDEWRAEGEWRFGPDQMQWRFVCPSCGHVTTVADWKAAGAPLGAVAFSCVGRWLGADDGKTFEGNGGPCTYAGGGLFGLNPVAVAVQGRERRVFDFAPEAPDAR